MCVLIYLFTCLSIYLFMYLSICLFTGLLICLFMYKGYTDIYIYMYIYICIYIYISQYGYIYVCVNKYVYNIYIKRYSIERMISIWNWHAIIINPLREIKKKLRHRGPLCCSKCLWWELHCAPEPDNSQDAILASRPSLADSSWTKNHNLMDFKPRNCRAGSNESTLLPSHWTSTKTYKNIQQNSTQIFKPFSASGLCTNIFALATCQANVNGERPGVC